MMLSVAFVCLAASLGGVCFLDHANSEGTPITDYELYFGDPATGTPMGPYPDLASAVAACTTSDPYTIVATSDDSISAVVTIPAGKDITLVSDVSGPYTITMTGSDRHFEIVSCLTLENIILEGQGRTSGAGTNGGIQADAGSSFTMKDGAVIQKCYTATNGGGVNIDNSTFNMIGSTIGGNMATNGGGVAFYSGTFIMSDNSTISGNTAGSTGGGVNLAAGSLTMSDNSAISGNEAYAGGGAYITNGSLIMNDGSAISGNNASGRGGGAFITSVGSLTMNDGSAISGNSANDMGGGVSANGGMFTMNNGTISGNTAGTSGGGIYTTDMTSYVNLDISAGVVFSGNKANNGASEPTPLQRTLTVIRTSSSSLPAPFDHPVNNFDISAAGPYAVFYRITEKYADVDEPLVPLKPDTYTFVKPTDPVYSKTIPTISGYIVEGYFEGSVFNPFTDTSTPGATAGINPVTADGTVFFFYKRIVFYAVTVEKDPAGADGTVYWSYNDVTTGLSDSGGTGTFNMPAGAVVSFTATDPGVYDFLCWKVNSVIPGTPGYSFSHTVAGNVTITAAFESPVPPVHPAKTYYITATSDDRTSISPEGKTAVSNGANKTFTFSADPGYRVGAVTVDGKSLTQAEIDLGYYTFRNVIANHIIEVHAETGPRAQVLVVIDIVNGGGQAQYSVNGGLFQKYTGPFNVMWEDDVTVTAIADKGHVFVEWRDGSMVIKDQQYEMYGLTVPVKEVELYFDSQELGLYFGAKESDIGSIMFWAAAVIALLVLAGILFWFLFFYRRTYEVIKVGHSAEVIGKDRVRRKAAYTFAIAVEGYDGVVSYRVGENGEWKTLTPDAKGGYIIPKGEITDNVTIEHS